MEEQVEEEEKVKVKGAEALVAMADETITAPQTRP